MNIKEKLTLVDFKTFNKVEQEDLYNNNEIFFKYIIEDYIDKMKHFNWFDEIYIMVDLIFLKNLSSFKITRIFEKYDITIYMVKQDKFIIHMKKDNLIIQLITINNEECENPLFKKLENSEMFQIFEIEQFARNFINLLKFRNFFEKICNEFMKEKSFLFDLKGRINYILEFCKKANNNEKTNNNCYILITYAKDSNNFLIDRFFDQFTEDKNYKNIILVRRTEFGNSFSKDELMSIIKYYFNLNIDEDINYQNRITWKNAGKNLNTIIA